MSSLIFYFELFKKPIYLLLNYNKHNLRAINYIDPGAQPIYLFIYARESYWSNNDVCMCVGVWVTFFPLTLVSIYLLYCIQHKLEVGIRNRS
jgi:hypothetical protein